MKRGLFLSAAVLLIWAATAPPPASAATTIGVLPSGPIPVSEGDMVAFSPAAAYTVPFPGVITSWTPSGGLRADDLFAPEVALKLFEVTTESETGNLVATVVATTRPYLLDKGAHTRFTRIPVEGGEHLGVRYPGPGPQFPAGAESTACGADDVGALGATYSEGQTLTCKAGQGVAISASLEPDDDGDGFGDETQDRCPQVAGGVSGCHGLYRGRGAGFPIKLRFANRQSVSLGGERAHTVIEANEYGIEIRCRDGYEVGFVLFGGVRKGAVVWVQPNGRFDYTRRLAPGDGILGGQTRVRGRLEGPRAHGAVSGTATMRGHGKCEVVPYRWTTRG